MPSTVVMLAPSTEAHRAQTGIDGCEPLLAWAGQHNSSWQGRQVGMLCISSFVPSKALSPELVPSFWVMMPPISTAQEPHPPSPQANLVPCTPLPCFQGCVKRDLRDDNGASKAYIGGWSAG